MVKERLVAVSLYKRHAWPHIPTCQKSRLVDFYIDMCKITFLVFRNAIHVNWFNADDG